MGVKRPRDAVAGGQAEIRKSGDRNIVDKGQVDVGVKNSSGSNDYLERVAMGVM